MKLTPSILLTITVLAFIFILSTFQSADNLQYSSDFFLTYLIYHARSIVENMGYFIIMFLVVCFLVWRTVESHGKLGNKILITAFNSIAVTFLSIFASYFILFSVAIAELNIMSVLININPKSLGLITEPDSVIEKLEGLSTPPQILTSEKDRHKMLISIAQASSGKDNLFSSNVLPSVPSFLVLAIEEPDSSIMMLDEMLIVASVNREELENIGPTVAALLVSSYFYDRNIKTALDLSVVDIKDYVDFRQKGIEGRMDIVESDRLKNDESIATLSARIEELEAELEINQVLVDSAKEVRSNNFKECIKTFDTPLCQERRSQFDQDVSDAKDTIKTITTELEQNNKTLEQLTVLKNVYDAQEEIVEGRKGFVNREQGIFEPPHTIVIPLDNKSERTITDFFTIFIHEYLHYASFIDEDSTLQSSFFEEGLTEYFSRKIIASRLEASTNLGYPLQMKIIERMDDLIHENELEDIYFTKDRVLLEKTLDKVFGEGFYQENRSYLEALQYTSNQDQLLKIANLVMEKIGGEKLTEKDLVSSFTEEN